MILLRGKTQPKKRPSLSNEQKLMIYYLCTPFFVLFMAFPLCLLVPLVEIGADNSIIELAGLLEIRVDSSFIELAGLFVMIWFLFSFLVLFHLTKKIF